MPKENEKLIIGIDGGGTKTVGALANLDGKILKKIKGPSSNPNKIGFKDAISNLKTLIFQLSKNKEKNILLAFLGLAGGLERDKEKKEKIKKALQKDFKFPIFVEGDQKIAFLASSEKEDGVLIIAGTGSISMGWREEKEVVCGGWDWLLGDQGSGFWIGKKAIEMVLKKIDGREKIKTNLDKILKSKLKIEKEKDFYQKFYQKD
ncbi:hypothetical protein H5T58_01550, partial [Candidatus Parcubacteria bacterium]|nr:hypothetical protein [Candidatus Parcubacteria bacterium]